MIIIFNNNIVINYDNNNNNNKILIIILIMIIIIKIITTVKLKEGKVQNFCIWESDIFILAVLNQCTFFDLLEIRVWIG